jgi:hypothetical protein
LLDGIIFGLLYYKVNQNPNICIWQSAIGPNTFVTWKTKITNQLSI